MSKILAALIALSPAAALADDVDRTIAQKNGWAEYAKMLEEKTQAVHDQCGVRLSASFDKSSYPSFDPIKDRTQAACRDVMNTLVAVCATPAGKEGVRAISKLICRYSATRTGLSVSGAELIVDIAPDHSAIVGKEKGSYSWKSALEELL